MSEDIPTGFEGDNVIPFRAKGKETRQNTPSIETEIDLSQYALGTIVSLDEEGIRKKYEGHLTPEDTGIKAGTLYRVYTLQRRLNGQWSAYVGPLAPDDVVNGFNPNNVETYETGPYKDVVCVPIDYLKPGETPKAANDI